MKQKNEHRTSTTEESGKLTQGIDGDGVEQDIIQTSRLKRIEMSPPPGIFILTQPRLNPGRRIWIRCDSNPWTVSAEKRFLNSRHCYWFGTCDTGVRGAGTDCIWDWYWGRVSIRTDLRTNKGRERKVRDWHWGMFRTWEWVQPGIFRPIVPLGKIRETCWSRSRTWDWHWGKISSWDWLILQDLGLILGMDPIPGWILEKMQSFDQTQD